MIKLKAESQPNLTENVIKLLTQNRICTQIDFLQEDTTNLSKFTKLSLAQILEIRDSILNKYSAHPVSGLTMHNISLTARKKISTAIKGLDTILNGGIPVGFITEICGLAGSGKTQLCMQLAANCVKNANDTVLYINTKGDFSALRIQRILDSNGYSHKDIASIMLKIRIIQIWTIQELVEFLQKIKEGSMSCHGIRNLSLIIIDSLLCLLLQHFGDDNKIGLHFLNKFVLLCKYMNKESKIGVVCVNILTRWIDQNILGYDGGVSNENTYIEKTNRCLGKYWQTIPAVLMVLERIPESGENDCLKIKVTATNCNNPLIPRSCVLKISAMGVN